MTKNNKIIVGISGGVDSSVAAMLLKENGYDVEGIFMKNWNDHAENGRCLWEDDVQDAMMVCDKLKIPMNTIDLSENYWEKVFKKFLREYKNGRTPNPDVLCNREIKFKAFLEHAQALGAKKIATGHYACLKKNNNKSQLLKSNDSNKDQSYFLCHLNQNQLNNALFPIGKLCKTDVRKIAKKNGLINHAKKDSTGICFIGEQPFRSFLSKFIKPESGLIRTVSGKTIGEHDGIFFYTLGQRQGLGIGGIKNATDAPWYVVKKEIKKNELIVAQDHDHPFLHHKNLTVIEVNWISGEMPSLPFKCKAKCRYRQTDQNCTIEKNEKNRLFVSFDSTQRAITPGQFIVFYEKNVCLGGGIIDTLN